MSSLRDVLRRYEEQIAWTLKDAHAENKEKGTWFERLCRHYFKNDPMWQQRFDNVWLWMDWPERGNMPDTGIDLVAKLKNSEGFCAIQCKYYGFGHSVSKSDIDTFITASGKTVFAQRILVSVAGDWGKNAEDAIKNLHVPCQRLTVEDMEQSPIDWSAFDPDKPDKVGYVSVKEPRADQIKAIDAVMDGFKSYDQGKLIMACGTGKTFTSLKIAEKFAGAGKAVLFLVPSIALLNQTLLSWNADHDRNTNMIPFAVCSDSTVGRKDDEDMNITDLVCPATTRYTEFLRIWDAIPAEDKGKSMTVVFSTYQSLPVITEAQKRGFPDFDLAICDEAHHTTGVTLAGEQESNFVSVHSNDNIRARKRLYMTATPRLFKASQARKAAEVGAMLCSMDDDTKYGPEFYRLSFSEAVRLGLLSDYKVMILAVDEGFIGDTVTALSGGSDIKIDDAAKIIGCWKGLSKQLATVDDYDLISADPAPMRSAVAFSSTIKNSKLFMANFGGITETFRVGLIEEEPDSQSGVEARKLLNCEVHHVDGKDSVFKRNAEIAWLKEAAGGGEGTVNECRILSNARCLSEGVDIPALDAILFLNPGSRLSYCLIRSWGSGSRGRGGVSF